MNEYFTGFQCCYQLINSLPSSISILKKKWIIENPSQASTWYSPDQFFKDIMHERGILVI